MYKLYRRLKYQSWYRCCCNSKDHDTRHTTIEDNMFSIPIEVNSIDSDHSDSDATGGNTIDCFYEKALLE